MIGPSVRRDPAVEYNWVERRTGRVLTLREANDRLLAIAVSDPDYAEEMKALRARVVANSERDPDGASVVYATILADALLAARAAGVDLAAPLPDLWVRHSLPFLAGLPEDEAVEWMLYATLAAPGALALHELRIQAEHVVVEEIRVPEGADDDAIEDAVAEALCDERIELPARGGRKARPGPRRKARR